MIVATPHIIELAAGDLYDKIFRAAEELENELIVRNIDIKILVSAEFFISYDLPAFIKRHEKFIIHRKRSYILMEMPYNQIPIYTAEVIFKLLTHRVIPIIAHPERNLEIQRKPNKLGELINRGALAQLNAGSLTGVYGRKVKKTAKKLLKENLIHMMGSDIHSYSRGSYPLIKGMAAAEKIIGKEKTKQLVTRL